MNIFILDYDPYIAATYLNDKHCVKMILETAQLLSTAVNLNGGTAPYLTSHKNHPCSIWARTNQSNYKWLYNHGIGIGLEYTKRYNKIHKSENVIRSIEDGYKLLPDGDLTDFALCMPDKYKSKDAVVSYRNYYIGEKQDIANWKTEIPFWFIKNG
jgi:hypothetical protein